METHTIGAIAAAFKRAAPDLVVNEALARRIIDFQIAFMNKNEEHMAFFGGHLTGVQVVRFTPQDMDRFFYDVVEVPRTNIEDELETVAAINSSYHVSGDAFNHTCLWIAHELQSSDLPKVIKERAVQSAILVLLYRYLTSLLNHYYRYPADEGYATAAYSQLSNKFAIRQYGNWQRLLEARAEDLTAEHGLHHKTLVEYKDDQKIIYALNDTQGRIRDMMKNLTGELRRIIAQGSRVRSTSAVALGTDGEDFLKDKTRSLASYTRYLHGVVAEPNAFIKDEILGVLADAMHTVSIEQVRQVLLWISQHYRKSSAPEIDPLIDKTLVHSFMYLSDNRTIVREGNDLATLIVRLKGVYMSSRSKDVELLQMRSLAERIVVKAIKTKNPSTVAALRTSILLYFVVRALTMSHYGAGR